MPTVRECRFAHELRVALAAQEPLSADLQAHVAGCRRCTEVRAAVRRFESSLDAATSDLVTDAMPPSTVSVARTAPRPTGRWASPRAVGGSVLAIALAVLAGIGAAATGATLSGTLFGGMTSGGVPSDGGMDAVDCYLGDPVVEVTSERVGDTGPQMLIAYCIGDADGVTVDGGAVTCVRSLGRGSTDRLDEASPAADPAYLGACTRVDDAPPGEPLDDEGRLIVAPSTPYRSWEAAAAAVDWPVRSPAWLPDGFVLAALQGFGQSTTPSHVDSVVATYLRTGVPLSIEQFVVTDPDGFRIELTIPGDDLGQVATGRTTVDGHPAFWADGVIAETSIGQGLGTVTRVLTWSDGKVGYRITARNTDLDVLRRVAESLRD